MEEAKISVEKEVKDRTKKLEETIEVLEKTNKAMSDRELKMIELKQRIKDLENGTKGS